MENKIKMIATLKGVNLKSKVADAGDVVHVVELKLELTEGHDRVQELIEALKEIVEVSVISVQPKLI